MPPRFGVSAAPAAVAVMATAIRAPRPAVSNFVLVLMAVCLPWWGRGRAALLVDFVAGHPMTRPHFAHIRSRLLAALHRDGAAWMEYTTRGRVDRARHLARRR